MNGTVEVESEKGRGSIFTVAFPRIAESEVPGGEGRDSGEAVSDEPIA